ncbi:MAG: site-2 protease family protein [Patescibacteria group bacterium]|jgi:Zn-dependent protease
MFFQLLFSDPFLAVAWVVAVLSALTIHEFSHAMVANLRGDHTAEAAGRLTLNPLSHLDLFGFISFLLIGYGWAKPVPFNPYNLKNTRWDGVWVALAGPASNFLLAAFSAFILQALLGAELIAVNNLLVFFLYLVIILNLGLLFFNLIPLPPLDGSKIWHAIFDTFLHNPQLGQMIEQRGQLLLMLLIFLSFAGVNIFFFLDFLVNHTAGFLLGPIQTMFF